MLHNNMGISRLMVSAQKKEEAKLREISREEKNPSSDEPRQPKSKKGSLIKTLHSGTRIQFPTKIPKEVTMLLRGLVWYLWEITLG